jgi:hypothetical protein
MLRSLVRGVAKQKRSEKRVVAVAVKDVVVKCYQGNKGTKWNGGHCEVHVC